MRAILSEHVHHPSFGTFAGIPFAVASSSAYGQDLAQPIGATRGQDTAQGHNLVHVYTETIVHSAVSLAAGRMSASLWGRVGLGGELWRMGLGGGRSRLNKAGRRQVPLCRSMVPGLFRAGRWSKDSHSPVNRNTHSGHE